MVGSILPPHNREPTTHYCTVFTLPRRIMLARVVFGVWSVVTAFGRELAGNKNGNKNGNCSVYLKPLNIMKPGNTFEKGTGKALRFTRHCACMFSATPRTSLVLLLATYMAADRLRQSRVESMGSCACKRT